MRALRQLLHRARRRPMPVVPSQAWFDQPDALEQIDGRAASPADREVLRSWVEDGYAVVEQAVAPDVIDAMVSDLEEVFVDDDVRSGMVLHDLLLPSGLAPQTRHADLVQLPIDARIAARDRSSWRVHGFYQYSDAADRVRNDPELTRIASMILGVDSRAHYSINFRNGSRQRLHEDSAVFHLGVANLIVGAWIACEDIVEGSGPLVYYPKSHRRDMFDGFSGYPAHNLRTADGPTTRAYQQRVDSLAETYPQREFLARKGDVLLWHGMLIHGGLSDVRDGITRRSYVIHFIPDGVDVAHTITGPTNW